LGNFASVDQVEAALADIKIVDTPFAELGSTTLPLHYFVFDKTGKSIVIESIKGKLKVYANPTGAMTNSPSFDWHLTNLNNYVSLSSTNSSNHKLSGIELKPISQGSGMVGLPGDFTSPSRFVRISLLSQFASQVETAQEGITLAWNIIDNINIPKGAIREIMPDGKPLLEYTQDVIVYDVANKNVYFRDYSNPVIRMVDMKKFDVNGKHILKVPMQQMPKYEDLTDKLKPVSSK
jgi:choloylglycine hydrolase